MDLRHVVVTMVARDDLPDGEPAWYRDDPPDPAREPRHGIEVLISDLNGRPDDIRTVVEAQPDILNHNVETVPRLQRSVRRRAPVGSIGLRADPRAGSRWTSASTRWSRRPGPRGLGEYQDEVLEAMRLLRDADVNLTIGQYLRPSAGTCR